MHSCVPKIRLPSIIVFLDSKRSFIKKKKIWTNRGEYWQQTRLQVNSHYPTHWVVQWVVGYLSKPTVGASQLTRLSVRDRLLRLLHGLLLRRTLLLWGCWLLARLTLAVCGVVISSPSSSIGVIWLFVWGRHQDTQWKHALWNMYHYEICTYIYIWNVS